MSPAAWSLRPFRDDVTSQIRALSHFVNAVSSHTRGLSRVHPTSCEPHSALTFLSQRRRHPHLDSAVSRPHLAGPRPTQPEMTSPSRGHAAFSWSRHRHSNPLPYSPDAWLMYFSRRQAVRQRPRVGVSPRASAHRPRCLAQL